MSDSALLLAVLPVLLVLSAIASGSETALFSLSHRERAQLKRDAPVTSAAVEALLSRPRRLLLFVLLCNMVVNVAYFVVSSVLTTRAGSGLEAAGIGLSTVLAIVLFGEILAKVVAGTGRLWFCRVFAPPLSALMAVLAPVVLAVDAAVLGPLVRVLRPHDGAGDEVTAGELNLLIQQSGHAGVLEENERRLLAEVVELGDIRVREVMTPADRIASISDDTTPDDAVAHAVRNNRTTLLVHGESLDQGLRGFLHVKRLIAATRAAGAGPTIARLDEFIEPALVLAENARLDVALEIMRTEDRAQAVCVDERGRIVGVIEAADIIDELVGGIGEDRDESREIQLVGLGRWAVPARTTIRDLAQHFGLGAGWVETTRSSTVGGLVMDRLGRLARPGDTIAVGPIRLEVAGVHGRRIETVTAIFDHDADGPRRAEETDGDAPDSPQASGGPGGARQTDGGAP